MLNFPTFNIPPGTPFFKKSASENGKNRRFCPFPVEKLRPRSYLKYAGTGPYPGNNTKEKEL